MSKKIYAHTGAVEVLDTELVKKDAIKNGFVYAFTARTKEGELFGEIWARENPKSKSPECILVKPYLEKNDIPKQVWANIKNYLELHDLGQIVYVQRMSNHPKDDYLYGVVAYKNGKYSCCTCWNETTQSLNHGHYNFENYHDAEDTLKKYYCEH